MAGPDDLIAYETNLSVLPALPVRASGRGPDRARRLPPRRGGVQPPAPHGRRTHRGRRADGGACAHGLSAATLARRQLRRRRTPHRRGGALDLRRAAPDRADPLRRGRAGRVPQGAPRHRRRPQRRGLHAARRALCRRLRLLEPLVAGGLRRRTARVRGDHPLAQADHRPPLRRGLHRQGRRADDRRPPERGRVRTGERGAQPRPRDPQLQHAARRPGRRARRAGAEHPRLGARTAARGGYARPRAAARLCRRAVACRLRRRGRERGACGLRSPRERRSRRLVAAPVAQPHGRDRRGRHALREGERAPLPLGRAAPGGGGGACRGRRERLERRAAPRRHRARRATAGLPWL